MENSHAKESADVLAYFGVTEETGLSPEIVKKNLEKYGYNGEGEKKMDGWDKETVNDEIFLILSMDLSWMTITGAGGIKKKPEEYGEVLKD